MLDPGTQCSVCALCVVWPEGGPWYGLVSVRKIMYRVHRRHMVRSMDDEGLFRLNTDVWLQYLLV